MADLGNFGEVAEFGSDFGKGIGRRSGEGELFGVRGAEEATRFGYRLTAMAAVLGDGVGAEWKRIDEFNRLVSAFHFGTPIFEIGYVPGVLFVRVATAGLTGLRVKKERERVKGAN
jgi:hypothetical protein